MYINHILGKAIEIKKHSNNMNSDMYICELWTPIINELSKCNITHRSSPAEAISSFVPVHVGGWARSVVCEEEWVDTKCDEWGRLNRQGFCSKRDGTGSHNKNFVIILQLWRGFSR